MKFLVSTGEVQGKHPDGKWEDYFLLHSVAIIKEHFKQRSSAILQSGDSYILLIIFLKFLKPTLS